MDSYLFFAVFFPQHAIDSPLLPIQSSGHRLLPSSGWPRRSKHKSPVPSHECWTPSDPQGIPKTKKTSSQNPHTSVLGMSLLKNKKPGDSGRLIIFLCFSNWSFYGSMVLLGCSAWLLVWSFQGYLQVVIEHFYKRKLSLVNTSKSVNVWWLSPEGEKHPWKTLLVVTIASWGRVVHPTLYSKYSKFLHYPTRWAPTIVHKWSYNPYTAIESYK